MIFNLIEVRYVLESNAEPLKVHAPNGNLFVVSDHSLYKFFIYFVLFTPKMTITYFNDISVYFHMRNHYKMLKNVKSAVDTSTPQSLLKSPTTMHGLDKQSKGATNEHLR